MSLVSVDDARRQCREDPDVPDEEFQAYIDGAEAAAAAYLNRALFADEDALAAAQDAVPAFIGAANIAYGAAVEAAASIADLEEQRASLELARARLDRAKIDGARTIYGMAANPAIIDGIRLTIGHLYANREGVIAGPTAAAAQLPMGTQELLRPYRRVMMP